MKTATLTILISQEKSAFNPSSEMKVHYNVTFKYKSDLSLNKRVSKYTDNVMTMPIASNRVAFELSK